MYLKLNHSHHLLIYGPLNIIIASAKGLREIDGLVWMFFSKTSTFRFEVHFLIENTDEREWPHLEKIENGLSTALLQLITHQNIFTYQLSAHIIVQSCYDFGVVRLPIYTGMFKCLKN